eukprot:TRINITY_DN134_c0_g1_i1.p1 TRINITY_DN134_c0_g1~~TRINITY_DN134_c0_g1_i1.p1  ORF type:complete len:254 (-),score=68.14 TRINITY_DN134_c0_g1_i1:116-877(-)
MSIPVFEQNLGEGRNITEDDVDSVKAQTNMIMFSNRLCPFAHRAFWTSVELDIDFEYVHIDLGPKKPTWYKERVNALGTVPFLKIGDQLIPESMVISEYFIDLAAASNDDSLKLLSNDPYTRAITRVLIGRFGELVVKPLYGLLMQKDVEKHEDAKAAARAALKQFNDEVKRYVPRKEGPYLLGEFSLADIAVGPFFDRFQHTLSHYRDFQLFIDDSTDRLAEAYEALRIRPAFQKTTGAKDYFIEAYKGYAL